MLLLFRTAVLAGCALIMLVGCAVAPTVPSYRSDATIRAHAEQLKTIDPAEQKRRWGDLASLADKSWLHTRSSNEFFGMDIRWIVPGTVMRIAFAWCSTPQCLREWTVQYSLENRRLDFITDADTLEKVGKVKPDGSVDFINIGGGSGENWKYEASTNSLTLNGGMFSSYTYQEVSRERLLAAVKPLNNVQAGFNAAAGNPQAAAASPAVTQTKRALQPAALVKPVESTADTGAKTRRGINGRYVVGDYSVYVKFSDKIVSLIDSKLTTVYEEVAPNIYEFTDSATGNRFGIRVLDGQRLEAFQPDSDEPGTILSMQKNPSPHRKKQK